MRSDEKRGASLARLRAVRFFKRGPGTSRAKGREGLLGRIAYGSYGLLSKAVEPILPLFEDLGASIARSGIKISLRAYATLLIYLPVLVFGCGIAATLILGAVFRAPWVGLSLLSLAIGIMSGAVAFAVVYLYPSIRAGSRRRHIDEELPYVVGQLAVLATAGVSPEKMLRTAASGKKSPVGEEITDIVRDVDLLGKDVVSALEAAGDRSASRAFSEVIEGMIASTISGGDLKKYLYEKGKELMEIKRIATRELADTLSMVGEVYVSLLVVFPLTLIIMFSVMASVSSEVAGFNILMVMYLLAYVLVPLLSAMVIILLDAMMPSW